MTWFMAAGLAAVVTLSGCTSSGQEATAASSAVPAGSGPVTVVAGKTTTLNLGGGAALIIPPGAMTPGATVRATYEGRPSGTWNSMSPTSSPVELISDPADAIHGLLTLEFPVPASSLPTGIDPATAFGVSTYDASSKTWTPFTSTYDRARHMIIAQIPHFSWWNPFSWDWNQLFADVAQGFGSLVGDRAGPAQCSGSVPPWVNQLVGLSNGADIAMHGCGKSQGNVLDVELQNNRPYGQVLDYGGAVKWGWHETGSSVADVARNAFMSAFMTPNQLYIPPLGSASVGILQPAAGSNSVWHIGPTPLSIATDLLTYLMGVGTAVLLNGHPNAACLAGLLNTPLTDISIGSLRSYLVDLFGCQEANYVASVAAGEQDSIPIEQLSGELAQIKDAGIFGTTAILVAGATWRISDLVADWIVNEGSELGNGFSVMAKSAAPASTEPGASSPAGPTTPAAPTSGPTTVATPPAPPTTNIPPPTPQPVDPYDNYGPANAGRAMCRGNPGNSSSTPGGTVSQTFVVPNGVASLTSALVQIDPDSTVTAHLQIADNGNVMASASAPAAGDTRFSFGPVGVSPGDTITLSITFTATYGKIITVYTAGSPTGTFTTSNSCADGAPNLSITSTGLRAVVSGMS